ncbi:MAG: hypothetical protein IKP81_06285 [Paludibacteraceae bacterium]|nr:hypothetical protein [Paludibacteraceae bacterium]
MKKIILILQFMLLSFATNAQEQSNNQKDNYQYEDAKSHIDGPTMEIVHFNNSSDYYRINKETGEVWLLKGERMYLLDVEYSTNNTTYKGKTNYQLVAGQEVYLMNVNTGDIWYLKKTKPLAYGSPRFVLTYQK